MPVAEEAEVPLQNEAPRARVLRTMRQWIKQGVLPAGETLPSERDISVRLGVALATVQRALKVLEEEGLVVKHPGRTRTVAEPKESDKGLMKDSVFVIGIGYEDTPADSQPLGWGGYVAAGSLRALSEAGLHTMVLVPEGAKIAGLDRLLASGPMGLIVPEIDIIGVDPCGWARLGAEAGVPTVVFGDESGCQMFDRVAPDHEAGGYELTKWILSRGRRQIRQYWTFATMSAWGLARQRGYERAMREAGLEPLEAIVSLDAEYHDEGTVAFKARSQAAAGAMLPFIHGEKSTDAIMVVTDGSVSPVIGALGLLGKKANVDVDIVGYDNYWEQVWERDLVPAGPLATVDKNNIEIGRQLVSLLLERRGGSLPVGPQLRLVKPTLRVF